MNKDELEQKALSLPDKAAMVQVHNDAELVAAADFLDGVVKLKKEIHKTFDPIVKAAHQAHKMATNKRKEILEPVERAERITKRAMGDYRLEQEKAQRQLEEEEKRRIEAEKARIAETAKKLADEGDYAKAAVELRKTFDLHSNVPEATPKMDGVSYRDVWRFRVVNEALIPRHYLIVDDTKIGGVVRALKGDTDIPGVEVYCDKVVVSR